MNTQERIDEIKEQIGYEDYTLYNIPMYVDDELVILHIDYKVPPGYALVHIDEVTRADEELKNCKSFIYQSRYRYSRFKKFIKALTEKGE